METWEQERKRVNEERFREWMRRVDAEIDKMCSLVSGDLPDCPYRDWWEDDYTPKSAARKALREAEGY